MTPPDTPVRRRDDEGWAIELRVSHYRVVNSETQREYHESSYNGSLTEAEAHARYGASYATVAGSSASVGDQLSHAEREHYEQLIAAVDAASTLLANYADRVLPTDAWMNWTKRHRAALCDPPQVQPASVVTEATESPSSASLVSAYSIEKARSLLAQLDAEDRPQHDEDCEKRTKCGWCGHNQSHPIHDIHPFKRDESAFECTCGLDALLARERSRDR